MNLRRSWKKEAKNYGNWKKLTPGRKHDDSLFRNEDPNLNPTASLKRSQKFYFGYFGSFRSSSRHKMLLFSQVTILNITTTLKYSRKWLRRELQTSEESFQSYSQSGEVSKILFWLLQQLQELQRTQDVADVFSGDTLEYHYNIQIFKNVVEKRSADPRGKLISYIRGETRFD